MNADRDPAGAPEKPARPKCPHDPPRIWPKAPRDIDEAFERSTPTAAELMTRPGFATDFLSVPVPLPGFEPELEPDAVIVDDSPVLPYEHFSLAMSASRRMARWVAWNIDGGALVEEGGLTRKGLRFRKDPRLGPDQQILGDQYEKNPLDQGHVSRRADLLWGTFDEADRANYDSFYFPNITPQLDDFNRASLGGLWGCLENALLHQIEDQDARVSLFGGPILADGDMSQGTIQVPESFWKILLYLVDGNPRAKGFLLAQDLSRFEADAPRVWATYERPIADLARRTSLRLDGIAAWDQLDVRDEAALGPVRALDDIRW